MTNLVMDELVIKHLCTSVDPNFNISIYNVTKRAIEVLHKVNIYNLDKFGCNTSTKIQMFLNYDNGGAIGNIKDILTYFENTGTNMLYLKRQIDRLDRICCQCEIIIENYEKNNKLKLVLKSIEFIYFISGCLFTSYIFLIKIYFNL